MAESLHNLVMGVIHAHMEDGISIDGEYCAESERGRDDVELLARNLCEKPMIRSV